MQGNSAEGPMWEETRRVVGCAMEVLNDLGHGFLEKPYENALTVEFDYQGIRYRQQPRYEVEYRGQSVGYFMPDLIVECGLVVDTKVIDRIGRPEHGQILNYLRVTGLRAGLILDFARPRLEWKRILL